MNPVWNRITDRNPKFKEGTMALIDLKRPKPKKKDTKGDMAFPSSSYEERPHSMRFSLEAPELDLLGLKPSDFSNMELITATVVLDPISIRDIESKTADEWDLNRNKSVEFQIMKIDLGTLTAKRPNKFGSFNDQKKKGPGE
jgi:hypothetical protein